MKLHKPRGSHRGGEKVSQVYGDRLIFRGKHGLAYLYERQTLGGISSWEVWDCSKKKVDGTRGHGRLPTTSEWGRRAWTFLKKENALARLEKISASG